MRILLVGQAAFAEQVLEGLLAAGDEIARHGYRIGLLLVRAVHPAPAPPGRRERADVQVGKVDDAIAVEAGIEPAHWNVDPAGHEP